MDVNQVSYLTESLYTLFNVQTGEIKQKRSGYLFERNIWMESLIIMYPNKHVLPLLKMNPFANYSNVSFIES